MTCASVREQLAALAYGDLPSDEAAVLRDHLETCPDCRGEYAALEALRHALDAVPPVRPDPPVDLPRLYREVAERQARKLRRWRRAAVAVSAAAAALLGLALLPRLEVRVQADQLTLRWRKTPEAPERPAPEPPKPPAPPVAVVAAPPGADVEKRLKVVEELIQIVSSDLDRRDQRQQQTLARVLARLQQLQAQAPRWRSASAADEGQFRETSFREPEKGALP
jgi:hypothetical protein